MTETPTMAEMIAALKEELAMVKSISGGGHEPAYYYLVDPPGKAVVEVFLQERQLPMPETPAKEQALPIWFVELPPLSVDGPPLVEVLSRALGLSMRGKWKNSFFADQRLGEHYFELFRRLAQRILRSIDVDEAYRQAEQELDAEVDWEHALDELLPDFAFSMEASPGND